MTMPVFTMYQFRCDACGLTLDVQVRRSNPQEETGGAILTARAAGWAVFEEAGATKGQVTYLSHPPDESCRCCIFPPSN